MRIYTKTGDAGETALLGGGRVSKADIRVAAYGAVDELNAVLGVVRATPPEPFERELLESVQRDLFAIGAQLASARPEGTVKALSRAGLASERVAALEAAIDRADSELPALDEFILPGGALKAALLHHARTVCRRAERAVVALHREASVPPALLPYLNRLSDLLFVLARLANARAGGADEPW